MTETLEEAEEKAKDHLGRAIDKFQDADRPEVVSHLETTLEDLE